MIRHILKQLWNKRRANAWIFLELILVTFFLWGVVDPVYVLLSNRAIPPGYDIRNVFCLSMGQYPSTHSRYIDDETPDRRKADFMRVYDMVKQYPGVESAVITLDNLYPLSSSIHSWTLNYDTLEAGALKFMFYDDGAFFDVFRIRDVNTGNIPGHRQPGTRSIYVTEDMAQQLSPGAGITGKNMYIRQQDDTVFYQVRGVMSNFKFHSTGQPQQTTFLPMEKFSPDKLPGSAQICFRIRDDLSSAAFAEQFRREMMPRMAIGNLYLQRLTSFDAISRQSDNDNGVSNKLRLQTSMAVFFLICTFLGIAGTFWLRSDARRGEIGLRMALGSSKRHILKEFLMESCWLVTLAWTIGILFVLQRIHITGFAEPPRFENDIYLQNRFVPHFLIVSLIVYLLMIVITIAGTLIPANQAASVSPAEALKEE